MLSKQDLLAGWFNVDMSGNDFDELESYIKRVNPNPITEHATKDQEWLYIMNILVPGWETDKALHCVRSIHYKAYPSTELCICGQYDISDINIYTHPTFPMGIQVGSVCINKIDEELGKQTRSRHRKLKIQLEVIRQKKWTDYNETIKRDHLEREAVLDRERDELVARVELEYDTYMKEQKEKEHKCMDCKSSLGNTPSWKVRCMNCYKKHKSKEKKHVCEFVYIGDDIHMCLDCYETYEN